MIWHDLSDLLHVSSSVLDPRFGCFIYIIRHLLLSSFDHSKQSSLNWSILLCSPGVCLLGLLLLRWPEGVLCVIIRPHRMHEVQRSGLLLQMYRGLSVCPSVSLCVCPLDTTVSPFFSFIAFSLFSCIAFYRLWWIKMNKQYMLNGSRCRLGCGLG